MADWIALAPSMLVPVVGIALVVGYMIYGHKQRAKTQADTTEYQAGAIAQKLGIGVERGDPNLNLFVPGKGGLQNQHYDVLLRGQRNGVPLEVVYFRQVTTEQGFMSVTRNRSWEARITARTDAAFGHFEATLRQPQQWNRTRTYFENPMQELRTGDARTDSLLRVTGDNPAIAPSLGALLAPLTSLNYVHVIGRPGEVSFLMSHSDAGKGNEMIGVGYALYDAVVISDVLTRIVLTAQGQA